MVSGLEMESAISEFETTTRTRNETDIHHHEQSKHAQKAFIHDVKVLTHTIQDMGNPFCENTSDFLVLDTTDVVDSAVVDIFNQIKQLWLDQHDAFVQPYLLNQTKLIKYPIKRNNLILLRTLQSAKSLCLSNSFFSLNNECSLFTRLYSASQIWGGDLEKFFEHENQAWPPALSEIGKSRTVTNQTW